DVERPGQLAGTAGADAQLLDDAAPCRVSEDAEHRVEPRASRRSGRVHHEGYSYAEFERLSSSLTTCPRPGHEAAVEPVTVSVSPSTSPTTVASVCQRTSPLSSSGNSAGSMP